ncbi:uncharacterized protein ACLA_085390 [Aspergillus clavatus NRRL 1]|uniref:Uncharacterized protein n=1 Tax=Aspergillus clavatus (strain ATCC 1007 / CBS 513.65 / DSM 816 / NCTC 3887 / NRRL 1 / QM 1276 / 107) TaxID=344612 RepID=A1CU57_ASPCL|nr:uncharacterized protein ACLA_085390 [Aspergillus clavatus NRRL 1]EAW06844.1 hypothetical protein ACLA_085390 [Aspergillus clavatus NRRL 1]
MLFSRALILLATAVATCAAIPAIVPEGYVGAGGVAILNPDAGNAQTEGYVGAGGVAILNSDSKEE